MSEWLKQKAGEPLFPDVLWNRPENKHAAGKLLIIGGSLHSFTAVNTAYSAATQAGIGSVRAVLPDALAKTLGKAFPEAEFAPSNPSGSFGQGALAVLLDSAEWADGVLLAGDFGKNSETAIVLEKFIIKYHGPLAICGDGLDYFIRNSRNLLDRKMTAIVAALDQLQKMLAEQVLIKLSSDLHQLVERLESADTNAVLIAHSGGQLLVAQNGRVSTTAKANQDLTKAAAYGAVWLAQQPSRAFEALTTAVFCLNQL